MQPESAALFRIRALVHAGRGAFDRASTDALRAFELAPNDRNVCTTLGNVLAWSGKLDEAWPFVEAHWVAERESCRRRLALPEWRGEDLGSGTLLVAHEQGYGDAIHMARYLRGLRAHAERVVVEAGPALAPLLVPLVDDVIPIGAGGTQRADAYVRMMMLPVTAGGEQGGDAVPYLSPAALPPAPSSGNARVGIAWAGSARHPMDAERSIPLELLAPLASVPGIDWVSLMHGERSEQRLSQWAMEHAGAECRDFLALAAVVASLDLVIAVDTAVAHLAGALGRPVWLLLARRPDWRWGGSGETTSWYPSMRLFRETEPSWGASIERVRQTLPAAVG